MLSAHPQSHSEGLLLISSFPEPSHAQLALRYSCHSFGENTSERRLSKLVTGQGGNVAQLQPSLRFILQSKMSL